MPTTTLINHCLSIVQEHNRDGSKIRKSDSSGVGVSGVDGGKDGAAYSALLRNELLGVNIDDSVHDDRRIHSAAAPGLYSVREALSCTAFIDVCILA